MSLKGKKYIKDTFCIAPWTEMHFGVGKEVMPCCTYDRYKPLGNLDETDDLSEIYNSNNAKELRKKLFNGERAPECSSCWKQEDLSKNQSYREFHNEFYGQYVDEVLENTNTDFSLKNIKLRRLDIRFDNKCNLKCRICSSKFSTSWYSDEIKLGTKPTTKNNVYTQTISNNVFDFIISQLEYVDEIFFAGGEPLIQDGHYLILEKAIELGFNDKIRLTYNTNFSNLNYKNKDIIDLWKKFQFVNIGASLDASHERGEYQRKNIIWDVVVSNRKKIKHELPDSVFTLIPTLGILNVYNLTNFHKEWFELDLMGINDIQINMLTEPVGYNIQNLPDYHKSRIEKIYTNHINWLKTIDGSEKAINEFTKVIKYIKKEGSYVELEKFLEYNTKLDKIRNESFFEVFPEYSDLEWYIKYNTLKNDIGTSSFETIGSQKEILKNKNKYITKLEKERDVLNKKLAEKDSFISKALHDKSYINELENLRDELNSKLAEKDSFINKALHDKTYIKELEVLRDELNSKLAQKDSFINKTLIESNYLNEVSNLKNNIEELKNKDIENIEEFFSNIDKISKRLTHKIRIINKETSYKSLL